MSTNNNKGSQNLEIQLTPQTPLIGSLIINNNTKIIKKIDVTDALNEGHKDANLN